ncbi:hypothetical protein KR009_008193 [Drosophila setifemur]|nr:hypothetical protein KR009_008193 [Drosophila setifemur]
MKFIAVACLMFALLGVALGVKDPRCSLPPARDGNGVTKCAGFFPSFSYYQDSNSCQPFTYGGCGGNDNRFGSQSDCEAVCKE